MWAKYGNCIGVFFISSMGTKYVNGAHISLYEFTVSEYANYVCVFLCGFFESEVRELCLRISL